MDSDCKYEYPLNDECYYCIPAAHLFDPPSLLITLLHRSSTRPTTTERNMNAFIGSPLRPSTNFLSGQQYVNNKSCALSTQHGHTINHTQQIRHAHINMVTSRPPGDDKAVVTEYFNNKGFDRWNRIYSDDDSSVNKVQLDIRTGHAQTIDKVIKWVDADAEETKGKTFCDAGCGVGSLTLPLLQRDAIVSAFDISAAMVSESKKRIGELLPEKVEGKDVMFSVNDLENVSGEYDTVCCIDVMIHYPTEKASEMISRLGDCSNNRLIISFAPKTFALAILKKIGDFFPGPSKATRAYLHREEDIVKALEQSGFKVNRTEFTGTRFYFSKLIEAVKE